MLLERVKQTIRKYNLIKKGEKVLVGVSGGPDSVVLLYVLKCLKKEMQIALHVAHLDHGLRPDSEKDRLFVEALAKKLKLPCTSARINVRELVKKGSLEEVSRNIRLDFFFKVAKKLRADKIALGHNLDDQAETVLMRILRGSGLYGLSGIAPKRKFSNYQIIRPLLEVRRQDIEAYLKRRRIKTRQDKTNLEEIYFRNKIRNRLLPLLEREYNKNIKTVLSNMANIVSDDYHYLCRAAENAVRRLGKRINLAKFLRLHPAIQRLALRLTLQALKGSIRRITLQHIREVEDLILNRPAHSVVDLPGGISVIKTKKHLSFYRRKAR